MRTRLSIAMFLGAVTFLGATSEAWALWCHFQGGIHVKTPECPDSPGYKGDGNLWVTQRRITNVCSDTVAAEKIDVNVTYPSSAQVVGGDQLALVVLMHGGGVHLGYSDQHDSDAFSTAGARLAYDPQHFVNPYDSVADSIASKGVVVIQPIFNNQDEPPHLEAVDAARAATCFGNRVSGPVGPGSDICTSSAQYPCFTDLVDKVAWTDTNKANIVFIGHSAGGVQGLYVPEIYRSALKGLVMIDPDRPDWAGKVPERLTTSSMPIVHIYPDYFGPHRGASPSELFRIGAPNTCVDGSKRSVGCRSHADCPDATNACTGPAANVGAWVPLGIREWGSCDPNMGCHESHHCTGMTEAWAFNFLGFDSHAAYCDIENPAGAPTCVKTKAQCGDRETCGQLVKCLNGPANTTGKTWTGGGGTSWLLERYVTAYTACLAAEAGPYYQQWVNGKVREYEDQGIKGGTCTKRGQVDTICGAHDWYFPCEEDYAKNGCVWSQNFDYDQGNGKTIRINNNETVSEYPEGSDKTRYYGKYEQFNVNGTGSFVEQQERLSGDVTSPTGIRCQSGVVTF